MLCTVLEAVSRTWARWKRTPMQHSHSQYSSQEPRVLPAPVCPLCDLRQPCPLYLHKGRMEDVMWDYVHTGSCLYSPPCSSQRATSCRGKTSAMSQYPAVEHWRRQTHEGLIFYSYLSAIFSRNLLNLQIKWSFKWIFVPKWEEGRGEKK